MTPGSAGTEPTSPKPNCDTHRALRRATSTTGQIATGRSNSTTSIASRPTGELFDQSSPQISGQVDCSCIHATRSNAARTCRCSWDWLHLDKGRELDIEFPCEPLGKEPERGSSLERAGVDEVVADIPDVLCPPREGSNEATSTNLALCQQRRLERHA